MDAQMNAEAYKILKNINNALRLEINKFTIENIKENGIQYA